MRGAVRNEVAMDKAPRWAVVLLLWSGVAVSGGSLDQGLLHNIIPMGVEPPRERAGGTSRIIGGQIVSIREAAFIVSLVNQPDPTSRQASLCGGAILTKYCIVTAGHCTESPITNTSLTIRAGSSYLFQGGTVHRATKVMVHPQFNATTLDYDLALMYVTPPFTFNNKTQPVEIAPRTPWTGEKVTNYGWGATSYNGPTSNQLRAVTVPVNSYESCERKYKKYIVQMTPRMFCQGVEGKDHCNGDSGGPVVTEHKELAGVVSWALRCAQPSGPGVNTDLNHPSHRQFIEDYCGI